MAGVFSTSRKISSLTSHYSPNKVDRKNAKPMLFTLLERSKRAPELIDLPDYQYLAKSKLPTLHFQKSLPRLPIPPLEDTCERYLRAQIPLLDLTSYNTTKAYVEEFLKKDGVICQNALIAENKKNKHTSYISKPWFDMYLSNRDPLPINCNPFLVFINERIYNERIYNYQAIKAANLVISSLRFYRSLNEGCLEPEVYHLNPEKSDSKFFRSFTRSLPEAISWYGAYLLKAYPLDMSQYSNLFNTTRIPELGKDRISHAPGARHILVMRRGHFYVFDALEKDGSIVAPNVILGALTQILQADKQVAEHPVGILTTANRDIWAEARKHLESIGNKDVLELIDTSLFNLVLDDNLLQIHPVSLVKQFLHADGVNRWFDKSFSLIVSRDGTAGINFEHSWGDGVAVLRYFNDIHRDSTLKPQVNTEINGIECPSLCKLEFKLDDKAKSVIADVKKMYDETCSSLDINVLDYQKFGRDICKPHDISPDAVMQLSFQLAHNQMAGCPVPTYESCSTAAFKHGRTETVRPCTQETQAICDVMWKPKTVMTSKKELQKMIVQCSKVHSKLIKEAAMGLGFDRHLFALKLKAESMGLEPALFSDPAYRSINHNILSTSTLVSNYLQMGAFGPVVSNGYGIGYSMWRNKLGCIITSYKGKTKGAELLSSLEFSLDKIEKILRP